MVLQGEEKELPHKQLCVSVVKLFAPAKINYHLHILGKRSDGYHDLESLMGFLNIGDEIELKKSPCFEYKVSGEFAHHVPKDMKQDLLVKAAQLFSQKENVKLELSIHLIKNLPSGAGLGGGSSDAAAVLLGLNDWFKRNLSEKQLCEMGLEIGSEIPVCIRQRLTHVSGRGEILREPQEKIKCNNKYLLLVWPNRVCSTAEIFNAYKPNSIHTANDLEETAIALYPEIKICLKTLQGQDGCLKAQMNGSGSSCFAIFENQSDLQQAQIKTSKEFPKWWLKSVYPLNCKP